MFIALNNNNEKVEIKNANKGEQYFCPVCHEKVLYRKCNVKASHFAHQRGSDCADWGDMSEWHLGWQEKFPLECREVVMEKDGIKHRADVFIKEKNLVIEFQHSPISNEEFNARNKFYIENGHRLIWVFDGEKKIKNPDDYIAGFLGSGSYVGNYLFQSLEWKKCKKGNNLLSTKYPVEIYYEVYNHNLGKKVLLPIAGYDNYSLSIRWLNEYIYVDNFLKSYSGLYADHDIKSIEHIIHETIECINNINMQLANRIYSIPIISTRPRRRNRRF